MTADSGLPPSSGLSWHTQLSFCNCTLPPLPSVNTQSRIPRNQTEPVIALELQPPRRATNETAENPLLPSAATPQPAGLL
jgi:hypothetical protein